MPESLFQAAAIDPTLAGGPVVQEQNMGTYLGEGAQYRVYDLGNGRVRKIPQTTEGAVAAISQWQKGSPEEITEYANMLAGFRDAGASYVRQLTDAVPDSRGFFGHPTFGPDGSVEQDKLTLLGDVLATSDSEQAKGFIDKYVGTITHSWKYGCYDWVFNLCGNSAVNKHDEVVMMDFGEMGFDSATMHGIIDQRKWEQSSDAKYKLTPQLRDYFFAAAGSKLTHEGLDRRWKTLLPSH